MPRLQQFWPLAALAVLLPAPTARAQAVPSDRGRDPLGYLHDLEASSDPQAVAVRRQVAGGPAALARARDAAAKAGIPLDAAALQKPLPPDGENAATAYAALARLLRDKPLRLPMYAQPLGTGYAYTPAQLAALQKVYDSRRDVWDLVHQAADRPRCVFARDWKQGPAVLFPEYQWLREASRLLNTETYLLAAQGRYAEAVQNQTRGFRLAEHAASDPVLISYLVGEACGTIALQGMGNVLTLAGPNADVAALVAKAVTDNRPRLSLRDALGGEAALHETGYHWVHDGLPQASLTALTQVLTEGAPPADSGRPATPVQDMGAPATPADRLFVMEMLDEAEAKTLDGLRQMIGASDLPPRQRQAVFVRYAAAPPGPPLVPAILGDILPVFAKVGGNDTRRQAREAVLLAAAAVLAARAKVDAYPDVLPPPSADPYTDGPLGYRREGVDGFVVYSVGPDGTFGGGKLGDKTPPGATLYRYPVLRVPVPPVMLQP
jgi:hypothetical protein